MSEYPVRILSTIVIQSDRKVFFKENDTLNLDVAVTDT